MPKIQDRRWTPQMQEDLREYFEYQEYFDEQLRLNREVKVYQDATSEEFPMLEREATGKVEVKHRILCLVLSLVLLAELALVARLFLWPLGV